MKLDIILFIQNIYIPKLLIYIFTNYFYNITIKKIYNYFESNNTIITKLINIIKYKIFKK